MYKRISLKDRYQIEALYSAGCSVTEIAKTLGFHFTSIYRELKKGYYDRLNSDLTTTKQYSADRADITTKYNISSRAHDLKIGNDYDYLHSAEVLLLQNYSPSAVVAMLEKTNQYNTHITARTLYRYIDSGLFLHVRRTDLPFHGKRKRKRKKIIVQSNVGRSIEERPMDIRQRVEFGHWEMDSVIGKREKGQTLVVLTERKTRKELIFRSEDKTAQSTIAILDRIEHTLQNHFKSIFKTITLDNGCEFRAPELIEKSIFKGNRTTVYYCHPFCSSERGSNEKQNQMIRRKIKKSTKIENYTDEQIKSAETWLNTYPRKMFGWRSSQDLFEEELEKLGIKNIFENF